MPKIVAIASAAIRRSSVESSCAVSATERLLIWPSWRTRRCSVSNKCAFSSATPIWPARVLSKVISFVPNTATWLLCTSSTPKTSRAVKIGTVSSERVRSSRAKADIARVLLHIGDIQRLLVGSNPAGDPIAVGDAANPCARRRPYLRPPPAPPDRRRRAAGSRPADSQMYGGPSVSPSAAAVQGASARLSAG